VAAGFGATGEATGEDVALGAALVAAGFGATGEPTGEDVAFAVDLGAAVVLVVSAGNLIVWVVGVEADVQALRTTAKAKKIKL